MSAPRVSVIMPLYNARKYVAEAVDSILSQTYTDFELIVVDNGSTDGSLEYAMSLTDPRVRVITEPLRGAGMATNAGIEASRAELLAIMDADDIAHLDRLRLQTEFMEAHPEVVILGARFAWRVGCKTVPVPPQPREHDDIRRALIKRRPAICNSSTMLRAKAVREICGNHLPGPGADFDFFLRMSEVGKAYNLPAVLHYYRLHDQSSSIVGMLKVNMIHAYAVACSAARADLVSEPGQEQFERLWSERSARDKDRERADCKALTLYRKANVMRLEGLRIRATATLTYAAMLSPIRTWWHLKRMLGLC